MPVKKRKGKRRADLDDDTLAWLRGENCFFQFKPDEEKRALWDACGDENCFEWQEGMNTPFKR